MDTTSFNSILFQTAFCCMASDSQIDAMEIDALKSLCEVSPLFSDFDFLHEANRLVEAINTQGMDFILNYLNTLDNSSFTEDEELRLVGLAIQVFRANKKIEYAEIKFFKTICNRLNVSDKRILEKFPDSEDFFEKDIDTGSFSLESITKQYQDIAELPKFEPIGGNLDFSSLSSTALSGDFLTIDPDKNQFIKDIYPDDQ